MKEYFDDFKLVEYLHACNKLWIFSSKLGSHFPGNIGRMCSQELRGFYILINAFSFSNPCSHLQWITIFEKRKLHVCGEQGKEKVTIIVRSCQK